MLARVEKNTIRAIEKISVESNDQQIASFFKLVKQTNLALQEQSEFLRKLDVNKVNEILRISRSDPDLAPIVPILEAYQEIAITALAWQEPEIKTAETKATDFLTTGDVAFLLGVSPQQVRTYCQNGDIIAWRTNGNRGEWRIQVDQYLDHPRYRELTKRMEVLGERNSRILRTLGTLSEEKEYTDMIERVISERTKDTGGQDR